jgi:hypothetical protein
MVSAGKGFTTVWVWTQVIGIKDPDTKNGQFFLWIECCWLLSLKILEPAAEAKGSLSSMIALPDALGGCKQVC